MLDAKQLFHSISYLLAPFELSTIENQSLEAGR